MANRIQVRRDTAANWTTANPVLAAGEPALETDTGRRKTGDGATAWTALPYVFDKTIADGIYTTPAAADATYAPITGSTNYLAPSQLDAANAANITTPASATATALNAAYAPTDKSPNYLRRLSTDDNMRPIRGALARLRAGTSDFRVAAMGDSITFGQNVLSTQTCHWAYHLAKSLASRLGVPFGRGPVWLSYNMGNIPEPMVTIGSGWTAFGTNTSYGAGMIKATSTVTTSMDIAFTEQVDGANILWQTGGGNTGDLIYSWDGGAQTTVVNPGGSYALANTYIPAPNLGTHILHLWQKGTAGNSSYYVSAEPQDSTTRKVRWSATGVSGKTSTDLWTAFNNATSLSPGGFVNAWKADLFIIAIGDNDQMQIGGAVSTATFTGNLENIRAKVASNAYPTSVLYLGPPPSQNESTWTPRLASFMDAAEAWGRTTGVPVVRLDTRWKDWTTSSAPAYGYYGNPGVGGSDSVHPGGLGTPDMGAAVSRVIAAEA